jgi:glycosyltransferase involved in cell wall biosynthesis
VAAVVLTFHSCVKTRKKQSYTHIALRKFVRKTFIECGFKKDKIVVEPNFDEPDPGVARRAGNYFLFVGRLSLEKGLRTMLRAWHNLEEI